MRVAAVLLILSLLATDALAGAEGPLAPGKPAGVRQADAASTLTYGVLGGIGLLAALLALQSGGSDKLTAASPAAGNAASSTTTTTTTP